MKKTFDEVVLFARTGLNPRQNFKLGQGKNKYITIKNIKNNTLVVDDNTDVVDDDAIKLIHKRSQIKKGDILFASIGRMGDMYIIEEEPVGWDINESVFAFTLNTNIVRQKYFYYIFKVKSTLDYLASNSSGSTFKSIKMNQLKRMVFDIPSLKEQDSIITILDKVCNVIEMRKRELGFLDEIIKARFVDLFVIIFYHTDFKKSIHFHLIFGILGIVRAAACQILVCYFTAHEHSFTTLYSLLYSFAESLFSDVIFLKLFSSFFSVLIIVSMLRKVIRE